MKEREVNDVDQHTIADWPVEIHEINEIPKDYQEKVLSVLDNNIIDYILIFAPACRMVKESFDYLFAYGKDKLIYFSREIGIVKEIVIKRQDILEVTTRKELLDAEIIIKYDNDKLVFPYVPSSYYLYDPFLNWLMGLEQDFLPHLAERENPRPRSLYHDSLTMFNYSLATYRLGASFQDYDYKFEKRRKKWMPWKSSLEEWLDIVMERGSFHLHSFEYLTECTYKLNDG